MKILATAYLSYFMLLSVSAGADLRPIEDEALSEMTGQSAIKIDEIPIDPFDLEGIRVDGSDKSQGFTRITIGANVELNGNIDRTVIGRRPRTDVEMPELEADVIINNLRLGQIISADDGSPVMENFKVRDPYIEIARNADNELTGVRLGFKEATGVIGHDIIALSGDITAKAYIDSIGLDGLPIPIGSLLGLTEYPYNHATRTNRISTQLQALGIFSPTLTLHLGELGHTTLNGTKNLYLGFQSEEINYPKVGAGPQGTAQPGFWLNLQDNYEAPDLEIYLGSSPTGNNLDLVSRNPQINNSFNPYY